MQVRALAAMAVGRGAGRLRRRGGIPGGRRAKARRPSAPQDSDAGPPGQRPPARSGAWCRARRRARRTCGRADPRLGRGGLGRHPAGELLRPSAGERAWAWSGTTSTGSRASSPTHGPDLPPDRARGPAHPRGGLPQLRRPARRRASGGARQPHQRRGGGGAGLARRQGLDDDPFLEATSAVPAGNRSVVLVDGFGNLIGLGAAAPVADGLLLTVPIGPASPRTWPTPIWAAPTSCWRR